MAHQGYHIARKAHAGEVASTHRSHRDFLHSAAARAEISDWATERECECSTDGACPYGRKRNEDENETRG